MPRRRKTRSNFAGKTGQNAKKQKEGGRRSTYLLVEAIPEFDEPVGGTAKLDILPYYVKDVHHIDRDEEYDIALPDTLWYKKPFFIHRNIGVNNDQIVCPRTIDQPCPICEEQQRFLDGEYNWQDDEVQALKRSLRNLYIVVPKGHKNYDEIPHLWNISQHCFQNQLNDELAEWEEYQTFPDLNADNGYLLRIRFKAESLGNNEFAVANRIDFQERDYEYPEDLLEEIPNLDDCLKILPYDELQAKFLEIPTSEDDEDDVEKEEETRSIRRKKKTVTRKPRPKPEPDPESNEDEDEEPAPKPKRRRRQVKSEPDEDDDDLECPAGYEFGTDWDLYDECDGCKVWNECGDSYEEQE